MALDSRLLEQVLNAPESRDVLASPIVTAIILGDPAHAADLALALEASGSRRAHNARRILCQFGAEAVPHLLGAAATGSAATAQDAIEILWAMLIGEDRSTIRKVLDRASDDLDRLLQDKRPLPDIDASSIERDFVGRVCDLTYCVLRQLDDPEHDRSLFRSLDDDARDTEIGAYRGRFLAVG